MMTAKPCPHGGVTPGAHCATCAALRLPTPDKPPSHEQLLREIIACQMIGPPYQGWRISHLNKVIERARATLGLPSAMGEDRKTPEEWAAIRASFEHFKD